MKFFTLVLLITLIFSCGYPDIDTVPNFKTLKLTEKESIDLCKINNPDNKNLSKCLKELSK